MMMENKLMIALCSLATLVTLGLATGLAVKLLGGSSSEELYIEPGTDVHEGTDIFDFSNTKIAGSTILLAMVIMLTISYICNKRIIKKLSRGQAPFVPTAPAVPVPAVGYNVVSGLHQLPDIAHQPPHPYRMQFQDFCLFPNPALPCSAPTQPASQPPLGKIP